MTSSSKDVNQSKNQVNPWEAYNFELNNNMTVDVTAISLYAEHFHMLVILEAFLKHDKVNWKTLNEAVGNNIPKHLLYEIPAVTSQVVITKMVKLGYIEAKEVIGGLPEFILTKVGLDALQKQTFQTLSATSFFNYQTHLLNKELGALSRRSHITSVGVAIIAVLSFIVSLAATLKVLEII
jgi:hypothetical protein